MNYYLKRRSKLLLLLLVLTSFVLGCGGGTSGTGVTRVYEAVVQDSAGNVLPGVIVTVIETGDVVVTDANGQFSIEIDPEVPTNTIVVSAPTGDSVFNINTGPSLDSDGDSSANGIQLVEGEPTTQEQQE